MSEFKAGQRVRVAEDAVYLYGTPSASAGSEATVRLDGLDPDGDVVLDFDGEFDWAAPEFLTLVEAEEPQTGDFQPGDRVRVIDPGNDNPVEVGDTGTVTGVDDSLVATTGRSFIKVDWDNGTSCGLFNYRLEKIKVGNEDAGKPTVKEGDLVRVIYSAGYTESNYVTPGTLARVTEVPAADPSRPRARREGSIEWPETFYIDTWEVVTDNIKVGDRVRVVGTPPGSNYIGVPETWVGVEGEVTDIDTDSGTLFPVRVALDDRRNVEGFRFSEVEKVEAQPEFQPGDRVRVLATPEVPRAWIGKEGGVTNIDTGAEFPVHVTLDNHCRPVAFMFNEVEKVEVTEGDNDTEDTSPLTLDLSGLSGQSASLIYVDETTVDVVNHPPLIYMDESVDFVNHPPHYKFSNGAEVIDITEHLTFNGGNAVKYLARSTRQDGQNKGNVLEDLRKARWYIDREIERIENEQG